MSVKLTANPKTADFVQVLQSGDDVALHVELQLDFVDAALFDLQRELLGG